MTFSRRFSYLSLTTAMAGGAAVLSLLPLHAEPVVVPPSPTPPVAAVRALAVEAPTVLAAAAAPARPTAVSGVAGLLEQQRAAGLDCTTSASGLPICVHGEDTHSDDAGGRDSEQPVPGAAVSGGTAAGAAPAGDGSDIGCYGDGTSGARVRAVYARPSSASDRSAASVASIRGWAAGVSQQFDDSAKATGGRRHVRFATTAGASCTLTVLNVVLPDSAFGSFKATIDALDARGLNAPGSKYLVWADAADVCGLATTYADDKPGLDNLNNSALPSYARIDKRCWGKVEAHELTHMLGGIQRSAPNATSGFHCNDGRDVMCYDDGTQGSAQRSVCAAGRSHLLDCRNDDYYSTAAPKGSYLQTHWNVARSSLLAATLVEAQPQASDAGKTSSPAPSPAAPQPRSSTAPPAASPSPSASAGNAIPALPRPVVPVPTALPTLLPSF